MPSYLTEEPLLDLGQIALLKAALGDADLQDMLSDFSTAAREAFVVIDTALASDDLIEARRAAHAFKGVAGSFGAARLAAIAVDMELRADSIAYIRQRMNALSDAIEETGAVLCEAGRAALADVAL